MAVPQTRRHSSGGLSRTASRGLCGAAACAAGGRGGASSEAALRRQSGVLALRVLAQWVLALRVLVQWVLALRVLARVLGERCSLPHAAVHLVL